MDIKLTRRWFTERSTIGEITVDGEWECMSLEDCVRAPGVIIRKETAIAPGTYGVVIDHSPRFGQDVPHILNVPGFEGVRIHPGNTADDTEGCVLVGRYREQDRILESRLAYQALFEKLSAVGGSATLEIVEQPEDALECR